MQFASVKERRRKFETPPANPTLQTLQTRRDLSHVYDAFSFFLQTRRARQQQQTPVFRNRPCELFPFFSAALHPFRRYEKCRVFQSMNFIVRSHPVHSGFSNQKNTIGREIKNSSAEFLGVDVNGIPVKFDGNL